MSNLSNINQMYIQQTLNPSTIQPVQNNPAPVVNPQPQVDLSQEPDVFIPSKKSHKKAIIGAGAFLAAAAGLFVLVKTGKLSFTGGKQSVNGSMSVPDEIIKKIDHVRVLMEKEELILPSSAEEIDGWLEEAVRIVN